MSRSREFVIAFGHLPNGEHEFHYEIGDEFFGQYEGSVVQKGSADILVVLEKKENMLLLDFTIEGTVTVECDRCLGDLDLDIEGYNELIVKIGDHHEEQSENVLMISSKEHEIDVAQYIYEFITLMIPMRNVHDEAENGQACNPEVLKEIEKYRADVPDDSSNTTDPRWEGLKNINLN